ncbi:hypothetical protein [Nostoc sp.]
MKNQLITLCDRSFFNSGEELVNSCHGRRRIACRRYHPPALM